LVQVLGSVGDLELLPALNLESLAYATLQGGQEFARWLAEYRAGNAPGDVTEPDDVVLLNRVGDRLDIVLNSPETRNSLSVHMRDALTEAFKLVAMDVSIDRVAVTGNGPVFSAGGDLGQFGVVEDPAAGHRIRMLRNPARYLALRAERYTFHVHRACIGAGIELSAFAGHLTATANTFFQLPELSMGLIPGAGGCVSIARRIGRQRTAYMSVLGKRISAERALEWGLIDAIVD
jgi:enoyl-CoA hydratase